MKQWFLPAALSLFVFTRGFSQSPLTEKDYRKSPYWISMMKDSTANYHEAEKAFDAYWSVRPLPVEEEDVLGHPEEFKQGFFDRLIVTKEERYEQESQQYAFDYKAFKDWERRMQPWIQPDGSITYPAERKRIWEEEMKKRNN